MFLFQCLCFIHFPKKPIEYPKIAITIDCAQVLSFFSGHPSLPRTNPLTITKKYYFKNL